MKKYIVMNLCYDYNYPFLWTEVNSYMELSNKKTFNTQQEAYNYMVEATKEELESLNDGEEQYYIKQEENKELSISICAEDDHRVITLREIFEIEIPIEKGGK